mmetsp:Transcript_949/g.2852  ORF Transcript_949/g.2852 Transcript_949/m.2852 type:complete len:320 (+) Transcript_949:375-1334(+)
MRSNTCPNVFARGSLWSVDMPPPPNASWSRKFIPPMPGMSNRSTLPLTLLEKNRFTRSTVTWSRRSGRNSGFRAMSATLALSPLSPLRAQQSSRRGALSRRPGGVAAGTATTFALALPGKPPCVGTGTSKRLSSTITWHWRLVFGTSMENTRRTSEALPPTPVPPKPVVPCAIDTPEHVISRPKMPNARRSLCFSPILPTTSVAPLSSPFGLKWFAPRASKRVSMKSSIFRPFRIFRVRPRMVSNVRRALSAALWPTMSISETETKLSGTVAQTLYVSVGGWPRPPETRTMSLPTSSILMEVKSHATSGTWYAPGSWIS